MNLTNKMKDKFNLVFDQDTSSNFHGHDDVDFLDVIVVFIPFAVKIVSRLLNACSSS